MRTIRFLCVAAVIAAQAPAVRAQQATLLYLVHPCRLVDTRLTTEQWGGAILGGPAIPANSVRNFQVAGRCTVPVDAKAVAANITAVYNFCCGGGTLARGWLTLFPGDNPQPPEASTINYSTDKTIANNGAVILGSDGTINVYNSGPQPMNTIIDINGYFK